MYLPELVNPTLKGKINYTQCAFKKKSKDCWNTYDFTLIHMKAFPINLIMRKPQHHSCFNLHGIFHKMIHIKNLYHTLGGWTWLVCLCGIIHSSQIIIYENLGSPWMSYCSRQWLRASMPSLCTNQRSFTVKMWTSLEKMPFCLPVF